MAGAGPRSALQAKARQARYRLLAGWCRQRGVLHLALAHHAGDQAETVLMRLARGAGIDGLAGHERQPGPRGGAPHPAPAPDRPAAASGEPGRRRPGMARGSLQPRRALRAGALAPAGAARAAGPGRAGGAPRSGASGARREHDLADLLAHARLGSAGDLDLPLDRLLAVPPALALAALARCLVAVGGETYPPRRDSLERLLGNLMRGGPARTLGGCRIAVRGGRLRVIRENRVAPAGKERARAKIPAFETQQPLVPGSFTVAKLNVNIM